MFLLICKRKIKKTKSFLILGTYPTVHNGVNVIKFKFLTMLLELLIQRDEVVSIVLFQ